MKFPAEGGFTSQGSYVTLGLGDGDHVVMVADGFPASTPLTSVERLLIEHVEHGVALDLSADEPVTEAAMRSWGKDRTIRAWVIRDIVRGRLAPRADPHGLRLHGARINGRVDLDNIISTHPIELRDCLLDQGISASDAQLTTVALAGCHLEHGVLPALDASRLSATLLSFGNATAQSHSRFGTILALGARLGELAGSGATIRNDSGPALNADDLRVEWNVFLSRGFTATGTGELGTIRLVAAQIGGLVCDGAKVSNPSGSALNAERIQVEQNVFLRDGFTATGSGQAGTVRLLAARIGRLECDGAILRNGTGPALDAERLRVEQSMSLRMGFTATGSGRAGTVRLLAGRLGALDCTDATMHNDSGPALQAQGLEVEQTAFLRGGFDAVGAGDGATLDLTNVRIGGGLEFAPAKLTHASAHSRLQTNGLTYDGLPLGITTAEWLELFRDGTPTYAEQPYQHLAAAHRAAGHDSWTRRILMAQRRDQVQRHALTGRGERTWARLTGLTLGYGYQPWRALIGLLGVLVLSAVFAVGLGGQGGLTPTGSTSPTTRSRCAVVDRIGTGLDLGTPLLNTGSTTRCTTTDRLAGRTLTIVGWGLRLLAWTFATLFIAGFTSAVRKT